MNIRRAIRSSYDQLCEMANECNWPVLWALAMMVAMLSMMVILVVTMITGDLPDARP